MDVDEDDEGRVPPRKKPRRAKRKAVDPTYKPKLNDVSDSDSGFDSDPSSKRRVNPPRVSTQTNDGVRRNYSEARTADFVRTKKATGANRKRKTREGDKDGNDDIPKTEGYEPLTASPVTENEVGKPIPEGKTSWFFSRMLQGMKNFWTKADVTTTTTSSNNNNDEMDYSHGKKKSSDSGKETEPYDSKESAPVAGPSKKGRVYYYNEAWHIPGEEVEILETISSGTFGDVARAKWKGDEVAVKTLRTPSPHVGEKVLKLFLKEVSILSKLRHPSIVLFLGASITPKLCIIMEYHNKGSLYNLIHAQKETIPYAKVIQMATEIAEGLNYLHLCSPKIIHRDVKSSNILVTANNSVKIADFGISKETTLYSDSTMTGFMGTSSYMSPEMIRGNKYTEKVDVYSFGILLWEMYTHKIPFRSMHALQIAQKVLQGERPQIPERCPPNLAISYNNNSYVFILRMCWHENSSERPSFKDIIVALNSLK